MKLKKKEYNTEMHSYIVQSHVKLISENASNLPSTYYIPYHIVVKADSTSIKNCLVWDTSEPTSTGLSLNDCLIVGLVM